MFNLQYLRQYVSYYIQTWQDGRPMDAPYAHARFNDLDCEARSQWLLGVACMLSATKQATCYNGRPFLCDLHLDFPRREAGVFLMSPPCLESQGCQFDPTFIYLLLFFCLALSLFLSYPFLLLTHSPGLFFPKPHFFRKVSSFVWLLYFFVCLSG